MIQNTVWCKRKPYKRFFIGVTIAIASWPHYFVLLFILSRIASCLRAGPIQASGFSYAPPSPGSAWKILGPG